MKCALLKISAVFVGASAFAAGTDVSGYVTGKFTHTEPAFGRVVGSNFSVPSAAVKFKHGVGNYGILVDLPFKSSTTGSSFTIASESTQAYVHGKTDGAFSFKAGQFDTPLGLEAADEPDRMFATGSAVAGWAPTVHRGLSVGYEVSESLTAEFIIANRGPTPVGDTGGDMNDAKHEHALNIASKSDGLGFNVGAIHGRRNKKDHWMIYTNATSQFDAISLGLELNYGRPSDNINNVVRQPMILTGATLGYQIDDTYSAGTRVEWMKHHKANRIRWTVGPQVKLAKGVDFRADYTLDQVNGSYNPLGTDKIEETFKAGTKGSKTNSDHIVAASVVLSF